MCFDICAINIRVSIRVRGLHLVFSSFCTPFAIFLQISPWCVWGNSRASGTPQRSSTPSCETAAWTSCATTPASWEDWLKMKAELTGDGQTLFASFSLHICFYSFNLWYHNPKNIWHLLTSFDTGFRELRIWWCGHWRWLWHSVARLNVLWPSRWKAVRCHRRSRWVNVVEPC